MTTAAEIKQYIEWYAQAAENAVHRARFDGIEVHGANGYLVDQFLEDTTNIRTDEYGGSIENRARFALDVIAAISAKIGQSKTAIRLSPWGKGRTGGMYLLHNGNWFDLRSVFRYENGRPYPDILVSR